MDKELRYGRVEIVEATPARVHVRWTLSVDRLPVQGLGRPGGRGLLLLSRRIRHPRPQPEGRPQERLRAERVHHPDARRGPIRSTSCPKTPSTRSSSTAGSIEFRFPNPTGEKARPARRDKKGVPAIYRLRLAKDEELAADLFQPERDPAAAGRLRAVLRRRGRWSRPATGEATGRWRGETRRAARSTTASSSRRATTA